MMMMMMIYRTRRVTCIRRSGGDIFTPAVQLVHKNSQIPTILIPQSLSQRSHTGVGAMELFFRRHPTLHAEPPPPKSSPLHPR